LSVAIGKSYAIIVGRNGTGDKGVNGNGDGVLPDGPAQTGTSATAWISTDKTALKWTGIHAITSLSPRLATFYDVAIGPSLAIIVGGVMGDYLDDNWVPGTPVAWLSIDGAKWRSISSLLKMEGSTFKGVLRGVSIRAGGQAIIVGIRENDPKSPHVNEVSQTWASTDSGTSWTALLATPTASALNAVA
jgi:hypothetical protein